MNFCQVLVQPRRRGNRQHGLEMGGEPIRVPGRIELNRWYNIRIELADGLVMCFFDGQLVQYICLGRHALLVPLAGHTPSTGTGPSNGRSPHASFHTEKSG